MVHSVLVVAFLEGVGVGLVRKVGAAQVIEAEVGIAKVVGRTMGVEK